MIRNSYEREYMLMCIREAEIRLEGIDEGKKRAKSEIAKRMLIHRDDEDFIYQMTELPIEEIRRLNT